MYYEKIKSYMAESAKNSGQMITEIRSALAKEKEEDEMCRMQHPKEWNRPISEQLNHEYIFQLKDLEQKYMIALNMDKQILKKYTQTAEWMAKLSQSKDSIIALIPKNTDTEFAQKNREELLKLSELNKKLEALIGIEKSREVFKNISDAFAASNYLQSLLAIHNKQTAKEVEFDKMMEPLKPQIEFINNHVKEAFALIDEMVDIAKNLNSKKSSSAQTAVKVIEDMNYNITIINEINDDFTQGTNFYNNLTLYLNNLNKIVMDYAFARGIDKTNRLQELEAQLNCQNFNKPQFFRNGQFPEGESSFRPAQPYPNPATQTKFVPVNNQPQPQPQQQQPQPTSQMFFASPSHFAHMPSQQPQSNPYSAVSNYVPAPTQQTQPVVSQYGYMGFGGNAPAPQNNSQPGGFGGFNVTESAFVPGPFPKK
jgi:hypothetical protein